MTGHHHGHHHPHAPRSTWVVALLDRTGSMHPIARDTEGAFNNFIDEQKKLSNELHDDVYVTLVEFDAYNGVNIDTVYKDKLLDEVPPLSLSPRGYTPLNDAIGMTIQKTAERFDRVHLSAQKHRPDKVIFVVMTDGQENASKEYNVEQVKEMVTHQQEEHGWEFVFLGVGIDGFAVAGSYGIPAGQTFSVPHTSSGTSAAYASASVIATNIRSRGSKTDIRSRGSKTDSDDS